MVPTAASLPPPEVIDGGPVYKVKQLLAVRQPEPGQTVTDGLGLLQT